MIPIWRTDLNSSFHKISQKMFISNFFLWWITDEFHSITFLSLLLHFSVPFFPYSLIIVILRWMGKRQHFYRANGKEDYQSREKMQNNIDINLYYNHDYTHKKILIVASLIMIKKKLYRRSLWFYRFFFLSENIKSYNFFAYRLCFSASLFNKIWKNLNKYEFIILN